jgi:hypothetical protein
MKIGQSMTDFHGGWWACRFRGGRPGILEPTGKVVISSATLSENHPRAERVHAVQYEHDDQGRLRRVRHLGEDALAELPPRVDQLAMFDEPADGALLRRPR